MINIRWAPAVLLGALSMMGCSERETSHNPVSITPGSSGTTVAATSLHEAELLPEGLSNVDWTNFSGDGAAQQYSRLDQIHLGNIDRLQLAWYYDLEPGFTVSAPVKGGDKLFTTTGHSLIRAFDAASGKLLWEYDAGVRDIAQTSLHMSWGNKGLSWWGKRVFLATTDGRVIALDDRTGEPLWEQRQFDLSEMRNSNGAPRVFDGKVIIGHGGADISPIRGYATAYDAETGEQLWRFYAVPGDPSQPAQNKAEEVMRATWQGDWYGRGGGGTMWHAFSYDEELNLIYLGVGNGFPYNHRMRSPGGGDNLFLASIVAVDADTGEYVWHYQVCPAEQWDCTAVQDMTIATLEIEGEPRKVLMQAPKNGFFYVLDAATGEFISAEAVARVTWAEGIDETGRPVENPALRFEEGDDLFELWPGPQGAHSWLPQAFSPRTGLMYLPIMEMGAFIGPPNPETKDFTAAMGVTLLSDPDDLEGSRESFLRAWNPVTQQLVWEHRLPGHWPAGILATAGDLVFQGRLDGTFKAYHAQTGEEVWSYKTAAPIVAPPISYSVDGRQYITVLTGDGSQGGGILSVGGSAYRTDYALPRHVLTFALDGDAEMPLFETPDRVTLSDPGFEADAERVVAGAMAFASHACLVCHGMNAIGGGAAPDLRYSPIILNAEAFRAVVVDGALKGRGMPPAPQLSDEELEDMRHYLRMRAVEAPMEAAALEAGKRPMVNFDFTAPSASD